MDETQSRESPLTLSTQLALAEYSDDEISDDDASSIFSSRSCSSMSTVQHDPFDADTFLYENGRRYNRYCDEHWLLPNDEVGLPRFSC